MRSKDSPVRRGRSAKTKQKIFLPQYHRYHIPSRLLCHQENMPFPAPSPPHARRWREARAWASITFTFLSILPALTPLCMLRHLEDLRKGTRAPAGPRSPRGRSHARAKALRFLARTTIFSNKEIAICHRRDNDNNRQSFNGGRRLEAGDNKIKKKGPTAPIQRLTCSLNPPITFLLSNDSVIS